MKSNYNTGFSLLTQYANTFQNLAAHILDPFLKKADLLLCHVNFKRVVQ